MNIIIGQDIYLIEESIVTLKSTLHQLASCDVKNLSIQSPEDWNNLVQEANHYSLFYDKVIIIANYDKKTLDSSGKKQINEYLNSINPRCTIILKAVNLNSKQLSWLANNNHVLVVVAQSLSPDAMKKWISQELLAKTFQFENNVPELIHQYTQGNMHAAAQVIERLSLAHNSNCMLTLKETSEQLADQCDYSLFELVEICLAGQVDKGIPILKQSANNKTEATLVLWLFTQEIRTLMQLQFLTTKRSMDFRKACGELNIWTQRINLYQIALQRLNMSTLRQLHHYCCILDNRIKSGHGQQVWNGLDVLFLSLCMGKLIGDACTV
ncbi:DNA polymerase III subunit delta [Legionella waltersii]|uniref:DNA polymerase III subunit delta n=1 Tax=Legionella waltersii TaxID=66969 RepID=UPI001E39A2AF|nr:DNA polymerase III subunit delta [Legionella waltersii]